MCFAVLDEEIYEFDYTNPEFEVGNGKLTIGMATHILLEENQTYLKALDRG